MIKKMSNTLSVISKFNISIETDYKKQDFENLNLEGLNLFGVPLEE